MQFVRLVDLFLLCLATACYRDRRGDRGELRTTSALEQLEAFAGVLLQLASAGVAR